MLDSGNSERPAGPKHTVHGGVPEAFRLQLLHWVKFYSESNCLNFPLQLERKP